MGLQAFPGAAAASLSWVYATREAYSGFSHYSHTLSPAPGEVSREESVNGCRFLLFCDSQGFSTLMLAHI